MDMTVFQASKGERQMANFASVMAPALLPRDELIRRLHGVADTGRLQSGLRALTEYVGASHYLLARCDLIQESGLDFIVASDWPFDLVKDVVDDLISGYARSTELEKCMQVFQPNFALLPDSADVPEGASRQYCSLTFNVGRSRLALMFLFGEGFILSPERLRDVGLLAGYVASFLRCGGARVDRDFELTDRELECLFWIAEGKTSDEIAMILGISRNTINNYITSVMRKTATKTRSEAIAFAVRNNLV
ncbi:helix-turn-helix transcriptional regulator [Rhizobium sp. R634]|uniref:transcriptional regulator VisN n=1 Tax=unclassified Rhizobium TaxID=2613769 RepID=UPI000B5310B2|nr:MULTISPECIES: helix-turn-helix transcriptional regulator [unclassified Rhizobium]OWV69175.1 helix-turn-helix transcriptional regulator [Rhizobium sp. R339]OWV72084.1 helix-turn-helix transcriptional regulator [Rhizobium sp. R634]